MQLTGNLIFSRWFAGLTIRRAGQFVTQVAFNARTSQENQLQVLVRDNNVEQALRVLKKKMQREGVFREMKMRAHYEKPSEKRAREKAEAIRRARKLARKRAQREGLIPGPRKQADTARPARSA
jgi:small subunit ribosomal protein S21